MAIIGNRILFWVLAPFVAFVAFLLPLSVDVWTFARVGLSVAWVGLCGLVLLTLRDPVRFRWAARSLTGLVFSTYAAYLVSTLAGSASPFAFAGWRDPPSLGGAIVGFLIVGLPCLWYTVLGRWSVSREDTWTKPSGKNDPRR